MNLFCVGSRKEKWHLHPSRTPKAWEKDDAIGNKIKCFHSLVRYSYCSINLCLRSTTKYCYVVHIIFGAERCSSTSFLWKVSLGHPGFQLHQPTMWASVLWAGCMLVQFILVAFTERGQCSSGSIEEDIKRQSSCAIRMDVPHTSSESTELSEVELQASEWARWTISN